MERGEALAGGLGEGARQDGFDLGPGFDAAQGERELRILGDLPQHLLAGELEVVGGSAGEQQIEERGQGVLLRRGGHRRRGRAGQGGPGVLGLEVEGHAAPPGRVPWAGAEREAEVDQMDLAHRSHQDVARMDVRMEHAALVQAGVGGEHRPAEREQSGAVTPAAELGGGGRRVHPGEPLHGEPVSPLLLARGEEPGSALPRQTRQHRRLALEGLAGRVPGAGALDLQRGGRSILSPDEVELGILQRLHALQHLEPGHPVAGLERGGDPRRLVRPLGDQETGGEQALEQRVGLDQNALGVEVAGLAEADHRFDDGARGLELAEQLGRAGVEEPRRRARPRMGDRPVAAVGREPQAHLLRQLGDRHEDHVRREEDGVGDGHGFSRRTRTSSDPQGRARTGVFVRVRPWGSVLVPAGAPA